MDYDDNDDNDDGMLNLFFNYNKHLVSGSKKHFLFAMPKFIICKFFKRLF